jgi:hypothetical protein
MVPADICTWQAVPGEHVPVAFVLAGQLEVGIVIEYVWSAPSQLV